MGTELFVGLAGTLIGGLVTLACFIWQLPKIRAGARKLNADLREIELRSKHARLRPCSVPPYSRYPRSLSPLALQLPSWPRQKHG
jgi:hypothetical protein